MCWTNIWQPTVRVQQTIFENSFIKIYSSHLYASFGTFWVQIGELLVAQLVSKYSEEFRNWRDFPSIKAISRFSNILQRHILFKSSYRVYTFWLFIRYHGNNQGSESRIFYDPWRQKAISLTIFRCSVGVEMVQEMFLIPLGFIVIPLVEDANIF